MSQLIDLLDYLKSQIGKPYVYGATGPDSYDCSGLTQTSFKQSCAITLPRTSKDQFDVGSVVFNSNLKEGDLLFFDTGSSSTVPNHVGVVSQIGTMVNANSYNNKVVSESYQSLYWQKAYIGGRRILDQSVVFSDVSYLTKFYPYIMDLYNKGVIQGYPDGTFKPDIPINRAEVLKIILEAFDIPIIESGELSFPDVKSEDWFFKYVLTAFKKGIVAGYPDGNFKPANNVNRVECLKIALLTSGVSIPQTGSVNFEDCKPEHWFYYYVVYAITNHLIDPVLETKFGSANDMKRGEMSRVVSLMLT